jgi:hypothetical protein
MKLLTDFDGVWTDPRPEARAQGEVLDEALVDALPEADRPAASAWLARARRAVMASPRTYGWAPDGCRISAFADEDPFAPHAALLHYIERHAAHDPVARAMKEAAAAGGRSLDALGGWSHMEGVRRVVEVRGPGILPEAAEAGRRALALGLDVVVVSNSGTDKLARWFDHAGVPARVHPESVPGALRLRGGAGKFVLDERTTPLTLGDCVVETARPGYERILREERPDAVVGDVFSLDLALPLALKRAEPAFAGMRLFWLDVPESASALMRATLERHAAGEVEIVAGGLGSVVERLAGERAAQRPES